MAFTHFDIRAVSVAFGPIILEEGLADPFFAVELQGDAFVTQKGADGSVCRLATRELRYNVQLILKPWSKHNAQLAAIFNIDVATPNGTGVATLFMNDNNGSGYLATAQCWIKKPPRDEKGSETMADKTWELEAVIQPGAAIPAGW